ncbi:MAG TPA: leucyl/phenylalanyl-tRNA--protein transferase [Geminicoccus sp.]|jgi:leucyl/phenylalanyl-tRNA--protein transferase|uniref:leucyl/phenylalanyl-tRNA--protein transferase n=1 Tax=Geminicoccus sp. TaxID=2024832 RepID=UPI002E371347|nr:leucyl/phenylalanyl-tRNA--protein transferase [Geminicoccus sp.]HEX2527787.1 leucyl/phenylalanyl-tRNA--protein transferase [Geminicoccus sp.]
MRKPVAIEDDDERTITPEMLLTAYRFGVFPMAEAGDDETIYWIDPKHRGIIPLDRFHVPKRLARTLRAGRFQMTADRAFAQVIRACADQTPTRPSTWLNEQLIGLYVELHRRGHAHSVETWLDGELVGGLYGVSLGAAFFGESMFSRATDASKAALVDLVARLHKGGYVLLDTQFVTSHLSRFGAIEIEQEEYRRRLQYALTLPSLFPVEEVQPGSGSTSGVTSSGPASGSAQPVSQTS